MTIENSDIAQAPLTPEAARTELEALRQDRIAGKVTDAEFFSRSDFLARTANGEQVQPPPNPYPTLAQRFEAQWSEWMSPPAESHQYGTLPQPAR